MQVSIRLTRLIYFSLQFPGTLRINRLNLKHFAFFLSGSRNDCITKARKTHQIPLDDENLFVHSNEDIFEDMMNILYNESDGKIRPIFCLSQEKSEIELVLKLLYERSYSSGTGQ